MISDRWDFEARAEKDKKSHIFAIKRRQQVESMPKRGHEIFSDKVFISISVIVSTPPFVKTDDHTGSSLRLPILF
jgi:hypothetical protein